MQYENILIIQPSFIGDVILSTPLVESLHARFPEAKIDFLLRQGNEGLFENHPFLHEVILWDKKNQKYKNLFKVLRRVRKNKYDLVLNLQRFASTGFLTGFSKGRFKIGFQENALSFLFDKKVKYGFAINQKNQHEVERYHQLIYGIVTTDPGPLKLYPNTKDFERVKNFQLKKYVTICPASVWFTKQYPMEKWVELIQLIPVQWDVYLLGSKSDEGLCESILNQSRNHSVRNLAGKFNFLESAALMKNAQMNYTNDSGPMHLATAVDAPVTAVFLSTLPEFGFGPRSNNSKVVETEEKLSCRPCGVHGHPQCPKGHFKCSQIDPKRLLPPK